jgi:hypothetical protein
MYMSSGTNMNKPSLVPLKAISFRSVVFYNYNLDYHLVFKKNNGSHIHSSIRKFPALELLYTILISSNAARLKLEDYSYSRIR